MEFLAFALKELLTAEDSVAPFKNDLALKDTIKTRLIDSSDRKLPKRPFEVLTSESYQSICDYFAFLKAEQSESGLYKNYNEYILAKELVLL